MSALLLTLGLWRCWNGGGIGKDWPVHRGLVPLQYAALALLLGIACWCGLRWQVAAVHFVGLYLLADGSPLGVMLTYPAKPTDKRHDYIWRLVKYTPNRHAQWWAYAVLRQGLFAAPWCGALYALGAAAWLAPAAGAGVIVLCYAGFGLAHQKLPTMTTPGDEAGNWSELVGWAALGFALGFVH